MALFKKKNPGGSMPLIPPSFATCKFPEKNISCPPPPRQILEMPMIITFVKYLYFIPMYQIFSYATKVSNALWHCRLKLSCLTFLVMSSCRSIQ